MALFPNSQGSTNYFDAIFIDLKCCSHFFSASEIQGKIKIHIMVQPGQEILQQSQVSPRPSAFSTALNCVSQQDSSPYRNRATRYHPRCSICLPNLPFSFLQSFLKSFWQEAQNKTFPFPTQPSATTTYVYETRFLTPPAHRDHTPCSQGG